MACAQFSYLHLDTALASQVCRAINELGQDKYRSEWQEVGVDEFIEFRDVSLEKVKWPQPKQVDKVKQDEPS